MDWEKLFSGDLSDKGQLPKNIQRTLKTEKADKEIHLKMGKSLEPTPHQRRGRVDKNCENTFNNLCPWEIAD